MYIFIKKKKKKGKYIFIIIYKKILFEHTSKKKE